MFKNKKLEWKKLGRERYYALSTVNNFVFLSFKGTVGWSNQIIFKKHLKNLIKERGAINGLWAEDLMEVNSGHTLIDCVSHTLGCSKAEFQRYVDKYSTLPKHSFDFYTLKEYAKNYNRLVN